MLETAWTLPDGKHDAWQPLEAETPARFDPNGGADLNDYRFVEKFVAALDDGRDHETSDAEATRTLEIIMGSFESPAYGHNMFSPAIERDACGTIRSYGRNPTG
ncbi:MAG: hypothetical protein OXM03_05140 [Chloroflexota bacterium]|nr:hypothetical protein [Chloroflexota bacterium]MDE2839994.1 hypothetical protein [Chloroflexota bacterium]MDE2931091.1 hypothetical protein [Chloroflexota bacterium]